jgi:exonuclease SbcC
MLKKLELTNFRKHAELSVDFTDGLNGIFGENYTGKTTLLYGVLFALGGPRSVPVKNIQRNGSEGKFRVALSFHAGDDFFVVRTKSTAKVFRGSDDKGELLATGTDPVNKRIEQILGMPMKRFSQLRVAKQKQTNALLTLGVTELHTIINEISGVDEVERILDKLRDRISGLEGKLAGREVISEQAVSDTLSSLNCEFGTLNARVADLSEQEVSHKANVESLSTQEEVVSESLRAWGKYDAEISAMTPALESARARLAALIPESEAIPEVADSVKLLEEVTSKITALEEKVSATKKAEGRKSALVDQCERYRQEAKKYLGVVADAEYAVTDAEASVLELERGSDIDGWRKLLSDARSAKAVLNNKKESAESALTDAVCSKCKRPMDDCVDQEALAEEVREISEELLLLTSEEKSLASHIKLLDSATAKCADANTKLKSAESKLEEANASVVNTETKLEEVERILLSSSGINEEELGKLRSESLALSSCISLKKSKKVEVKGAASVVDELEEKLALMKAPDLDKVSQEYADSIKGRLTDQRARLTEVSSKLNELRVRQSGLKVQLDGAYEMLEKVKTNNRMIAECETDLSTSKGLRTFLRDNRDNFIRDVWASLMMVASDFASKATGGAIESISRSDDGKFLYTEAGCEMDVAEASGAQSSIMGLAVQTAIAASLPCPLDVCLVDEPTADMDAEHSMATAMMLSAQGGQVVCVSHSQMDNSVCSNVIYLERK